MLNARAGRMAAYLCGMSLCLVALLLLWFAEAEDTTLEGRPDDGASAAGETRPPPRKHSDPGVLGHDVLPNPAEPTPVAVLCCAGGGGGPGGGDTMISCPAFTASHVCFPTVYVSALLLGLGSSVVRPFSRAAVSLSSKDERGKDRRR